MLSFATEFPVSPTCKTSAFLDAVRFWLLHSPHTTLVSEDLANPPASGPWTIIKTDERFDALLFAANGEEAAAIKHSRLDGDINWETIAVFSANGRDAWISVRTSRESIHPATRLPPARKPRLIRTLLEMLGGAADGRMTVTQSPRRLKNSEIGLAASLIKGTSDCHLPVVYLSCGFDGKYRIDPGAIAHDLAGMAHIVVEPNRPFSQRLQIEVKSDNVYGGAIGIYWPNGQGRRSKFLEHNFDDQKSLKSEVVEEIRTALLNRRPTFRCTWSAVEENSSRSAYNALKESGSQEIERYIDVFDTEIKAKEEQIRAAEQEISRLQAEVRRLDSNTTAANGVNLQVGDEQDYFAGEITQIVVDAIKDAQKHISADSRRGHVLDAIIRASPSATAGAEYREQLKDILRSYRSMDTKTRKALENMGFSISEDGKHHKLIFYNDPRYTFVLSKSGSDHRAGLNAVSEIAKRLF